MLVQVGGGNDDSAPGHRAFDAECAALLGIVRTLKLDDFDRATNCPPWTLHELLVHIAFSLRLPDPALSVVPAALPRGTAADYYRRPERNTVEYRAGNAEHTRHSAAAVRADDVAALFTDAWKRTPESAPPRIPIGGSRPPAARSRSTTIC